MMAYTKLGSASSVESRTGQSTLTFVVLTGGAGALSMEKGYALLVLLQSLAKASSFAALAASAIAAAARSGVARLLDRRAALP